MHSCSTTRPWATVSDSHVLIEGELESMLGSPAGVESLGTAAPQEHKGGRVFAGEVRHRQRLDLLVRPADGAKHNAIHHCRIGNAAGPRM